MNLDRILNKAIEEIDFLEEYYETQYNNTIERNKYEFQRYRYGLAVYKYMCAKIHVEENPHCLSQDEKDFLSREIEEFDDEEGNLKYRIKNAERYEKEYELNPFVAETKTRSLMGQPDLLSNSTLVMLMIRFENMIANIYRELLKKYSEAYIQNKSITYSELLAMDSDLETVKNRLIDTAVDEFMRKPIKEWYAALRKHNVEFNFDEEYAEFKEIYYRRNIIVHNQGIVNESYIKGLDNSTQAKIGNKLIVDNNYLYKAFDITRMVVIETIYSLKKLTSRKKKLADCLFSIGYNYMLVEKWTVSKYIFSRLMAYPDRTEVENWLYKVNYYVSVKNENGIEAIIEPVSSIDTSLMKPSMAIAKPALLDEFERINQILTEEIEISITVENVKTWPLFKQYRESDEYKEFVKNHKELFSLEDFSQDKVDCLSKKD